MLLFNLLRMDINALNNMLFDTKSTVFDLVNPAGDVIGKKQPKEQNLMTDNDFESAYSQAVNNTDNTDLQQASTETNNDQNDPERQIQQENSQDVTENQQAQYEEQDQKSTEQQSDWKNEEDKGGPQANALTRLKDILGKLEDTPGNASQAVNRVIGKFESGMVGSEQQIPVQNEITAQVGNAVQANQLTTEKTQQNTDETQAIQQGGQQSGQKSVQPTADAQIQDAIKAQTDQNQQQTQQTGMNLEPQQTEKGNQPASQNNNNQLQNILNEKASEQIHKENGKEEGSLNEDLSQQQNLGQMIQQQKAEFETKTGQNETNSVDQSVSVFSSSNENKQVQQTALQAENSDFNFQNKFGDAVSEKLQTAIASSVKNGQNEVTVNLNPPELGKVSIRLQQENGQITGTLQFNKAETKSEVQQLLPQVIQNLQNSGITVKKLDVIQTGVDNSNTYQQYKDNYNGEGTFNQQNFGQSHSSDMHSGYDWVTGESSYTSGDYYSSSYIEDDSMNILV